MESYYYEIDGHSWLLLRKNRIEFDVGDFNEIKLLIESLTKLRKREIIVSLDQRNHKISVKSGSTSPPSIFRVNKRDPIKDFYFLDIGVDLIPDEWFLVSDNKYLNTDITFYKCDQIDGLRRYFIDFFEKQFNI